MNRLRSDKFKKVNSLKIRNAEAAKGFHLIKKEDGSFLWNFIKKSFSFSYSSALFVFYLAMFLMVELVCEDVMAYAFTQNAFIVQNIEIQNNIFIKKEDIVSFVTDNFAKDMVHCDLQKIKQELLKLENVEQVEVKKEFPGKLVIKIIERTPLFRTEIGGELIDRYGQEVKVDKQFARYAHLPVLKGFSLMSYGGIANNDLSRFKKMLSIYKIFSTDVNLRNINLKKINSDVEWCDLFLNNDMRVRLAYQDINGKMDKLSFILTDLKRRKKNAGYVDLRFDNVVVKS